ncbi:hypothetical protein E2P81_ATG06304 [Venturia nashicola]|nr:hypothetical protein E2P81_ATG06304 [Venturia nashicola]
MFPRCEGSLLRSSINACSELCLETHDTLRRSSCRSQPGALKKVLAAKAGSQTESAVRDIDREMGWELEGDRIDGGYTGLGDGDYRGTPSSSLPILAMPFLTLRSISSQEIVAPCVASREGPINNLKRKRVYTNSQHEMA